MNKVGLIIGVGVIGVVAWLAATGKFGGLLTKIGVTKAAVVPIPEKTAAAAQAPVIAALVTSVPPENAQLYAIGGIQMAYFTKPIPLGNTGFYQWGVTPTGEPIVSKNDPQSYGDYQWGEV